MSDLITTIPQTAITIPGINQLHHAATQLAEEARTKANAATQMALLIGLKLIALKAATPHGQWEKLFKSAARRVGKPNIDHGQHLEMDNTTARKYIAVATEIINRRLTPEHAQALQHIAAAPALEKADAALLEEITPPETLRQLYLQMGIVKPTRKELHAMTAPLREEEGPEEPQDKTPLTPAQRIAQKRDEARHYWFGTTNPEHVAPGFIMAIQQELNQPEKGRLHYLAKDDLHTMEELLAQLLKRIKKIKTEIS
jgi:hypothetical protein